MNHKGRKPLAAGHVEHLSGSELAKLRLSMILKTMLGELTVAEARAQLGICESRFHALRHQWLQQALELLEPRRAGRPPKLETDESRQIAQLEATLAALEHEVDTAEVRQQIAEIRSRVTLQTEPSGKKTRATMRRQLRRRQRLRQRRRQMPR